MFFNSFLLLVGLFGLFHLSLGCFLGFFSHSLGCLGFLFGYLCFLFGILDCLGLCLEFSFAPLAILLSNPSWISVLDFFSDRLACETTNVLDELLTVKLSLDGFVLLLTESAHFFKFLVSGSILLGNHDLSFLLE